MTYGEYCYKERENNEWREQILSEEHLERTGK